MLLAILDKEATRMIDHYLQEAVDTNLFGQEVTYRFSMSRIFRQGLVLAQVSV